MSLFCIADFLCYDISLGRSLGFASLGFSFHSVRYVLFCTHVFQPNKRLAFF